MGIKFNHSTKILVLAIITVTTLIGCKEYRDLKNGVVTLKGESIATNRVLALSETRATALADACYSINAYAEELTKIFNKEFQSRFVDQKKAERLAGALITTVTSCKSTGIFPVSELKGGAGNYYRFFAFPLAENVKNAVDEGLRGIEEEDIRGSVEEFQTEMRDYIDNIIQ